MLKFCPKDVKGHHGSWTEDRGLWGRVQVLPDGVNSASPVQAWVEAYKEPPSGLWTVNLQVAEGTDEDLSTWVLMTPWNSDCQCL